MIKQRTFEIAFYFGASVALYGLGLYTMYKAVSCKCYDPSAGGAGKTEEKFRCDTMHLERATTYQPTMAQCDDNPLSTADGSVINPNKYQRWVALSRDLICDPDRRELFPEDTNHWRGQFHFGDTITTYSKSFPHLNGDWVVHDCMAPRYKMSIDFLLAPEDNVPKLGVGTDVKIIYCGINY